MPSSTPGADDPLVLIVDDNEKNLKLARDVLHAAGLRTLVATSGADAVALATEHVPDVILLDLRLPDVDGTEVLWKLRDDVRTAPIPVVALSALQVGADAMRAAGFAGSIAKPIHVRAFPEQVRGFCAAPAD
jgi:two-component system cell cycle response regulator DivK